MATLEHRICFGIQAHHDPDLCERLVRLLCREGDAVILHVNQKEKVFREHVTDRVRDVEGLYLVPLEESVPVNWSGFSQVRATLVLLKHFLKLPPQFRWFSFHSGQDYPIKPIAQYREFLINNDPNMLIEFASNPMLWRCQLYNFFRENPLNRTLLFTMLDNILRKLQQPFIRRNRGIDFKRGSNWFTANRNTAMQLLKASTQEWQELWKYTAVPDEHYFQTLSNMLGIPVTSDNYRFILWEGNSSSPATLRTEHLSDLLEAKDFFARKFSSADIRILDLLDHAACRNNSHARELPTTLTEPA